MAAPDTVLAETISYPGGGGDPVEAYLARPLQGGARGGVVMIHHMPGYDESTKEITRRFAVMGYNAICPNLYSREAPGASPDDAAATARALGGVPDDRLVADVDAAATVLRGLTTANGRVGVIGHCSGGRQAFLAACRLQLDAAVDCYGGFVTGTPPPDWPLKVGPIVHLAPSLSCPLLGLFGAEDRHPSTDDVAELDRALDDAGKDHEFHIFEGAGHGFFWTERPSYSVTAAVEGWAHIERFFAEHLGGH